MAENYVLLERIELNASAASVTFSNIPGTGYTDLKIVISSRDTNTSSYWSNIVMTFNGTSTGYSSKILADADGSATSATGGSTAIIYTYSVGPSATANTFSNSEIYIPNYAGSNYKSFSIDSVTENNGTQILLGMTAGLWSNAAAINTIAFVPANSASFVSGSTFSLYGIAAVGTTPAVAPKATGGNVIAYDGTYWYHAFTSNGTFTPATGLSTDVLVVAGGGAGAGGGGSGGSGAGGAGGVLYLNSQTLTTTNYAITVGAGGASSGAQAVGSPGANSTFNGNTAIGGGRGGRDGTAGGAGGTGGSGGGGGAASGGAGAGTSGQGTNGGAGTTNQGGGGGGASVAGTAGNNSVGGGAGGNGTYAYSAWSTATGTGASGYYAGGGGGGALGNTQVGGAGGAGGGAAGSKGDVANANATASTGGGGGGGGYNTLVSPTFGGSGGSGVVIVRYLAA